MELNFYHVSLYLNNVIVCVVNDARMVLLWLRCNCHFAQNFSFKFLLGKHHIQIFGVSGFPVAFPSHAVQCLPDSIITASVRTSHRWCIAGCMSKDDKCHCMTVSKKYGPQTSWPAGCLWSSTIIVWYIVHQIRELNENSISICTCLFWLFLT